MNWKLNYWTLLFVLAAGSALYQRYTAGGQPQASEEKGMTLSCAPGQDFSIADSIAYERIDRYSTNYAPKVRTFAADSCNTLNGGVMFFGIKACELQTMVDTFQVADSVIARLALIPGTNGAKDTLDLIFEVYSTLGPILIPKYYDFTTPCPPCSANER